MSFRADQSNPTSQARHKRTDAESRTNEEKLKSENFIIKRENDQLKQKYKDVAAKNTRYRNKDELSEKEIATHLAEIARLESRNRKTLQKLDDTLMEITRLKANNVVLEEAYHKQSKEISAGEKRFDDYIQAVTNLTWQFRRSHPDLTTHRPSTRAFTSDGCRQHDTEDSQLADMDSVSSMPRTDGGIISAPRLQEESEETNVTNTLASPVIKHEQQVTHNHDKSTSTDATSYAKVSTTALEVLPSISGRVQAGHHSLSSTDEQETLQHSLKASEGCPSKRARLPDEALGHLVNKRMRQEHSRYADRSHSKATEPRLHFRQR